MNKTCGDNSKWSRRLLISSFIAVPSLTVSAGVSYQWISDQQDASTLVLKIFVALFAIIAGIALVISIYMKRSLMPPLRNRIKEAQDLLHAELKPAAKTDDVKKLAREFKAVRLRMSDTVGKCAEESQKLSEPTSKQAA